MRRHTFFVAEDRAPADERQISGQDEGDVLVAAGHELEEQIPGVLVKREVADLVDDDQHSIPGGAEGLIPDDWPSPSTLPMQNLGQVRSTKTRQMPFST